MKFIGKANLIGNIYNTIILEQDKDSCVVSCNALSKNILNYLDNNLVGNFVSSLDSLDSDYDKLLAIMDYFIDYNEVSYIYNQVNVKGLKGKFIKVGNNDRQLLIKLNEYNELIYNKIFNKYVMSLYKYIYDLLNNGDVDVISFKKTDNVTDFVYKNGLRPLKGEALNTLYISYVGNIPDYLIRIINDLIISSKKVSCNFSDYKYGLIKLDTIDLNIDCIDDLNKVIPIVFDNIIDMLTCMKEDAKQLVFMKR